MLKDQSELLEVLNAHNVEDVVVGGDAVAAYGVSRLTRDLHISLRDSPENGQRTLRAPAAYGAPPAAYDVTDFSGHPTLVIRFGVPPGHIDMLQRLEGVDGHEVFLNRTLLPVTEELLAPGYRSMICFETKDAVGRLQDVADADKLRKVNEL